MNEQDNPHVADGDEGLEGLLEETLNEANRLAATPTQKDLLAETANEIDRTTQPGGGSVSPEHFKPDGLPAATVPEATYDGDPTELDPQSDDIAGD